MGCHDLSIKDAPGSNGFCGGRKSSEIWDNPYFFPAHRQVPTQVSALKPCCGLATTSDTLESPSEATNWQFADDVAHLYFRNETSSLLLGMQGYTCEDKAQQDEEKVQEGGGTRYPHAKMLELASHDRKTSSLESMTENYEFPTLKNDLPETSIYGELACLEKLSSSITSIETDLDTMQTTSTMPSMDDFVSVLKMCRQKKDPVCARHAHFHICRNGLEAHTVLGNFLVPMFVECGCLAEGQQVFNRFVNQNEHSWTSVIQGLINRGELQDAFNLFKRMEHFSVHPSTFTFVALLKACAIERQVETGRELHAKITKQGHEADTFVGNVLVDVYSKCGLLEEAQQVFNKLPVHDVVSWNTLIAGYVDHNHSEKALRCLEEMQLKGIPPNHLTFTSGLQACGSIGALEKGQGIHVEIARDGYECTSNLGSTLVDMYAKCGLLVEARDVFDSLRERDAISWNPLIIGYADKGLENEALECLENMKLEGTLPDTVALAGCIKACGSIGAVWKGREIHADCTKQGVEKDTFVGSTLVDMYSKLGSVLDAQDVFNKLPVRGVVPWTALIAGYADCGLAVEALNCLQQMQVEGVLANDVTLVCSLKACGSTEDVEMGRQLHMDIIKVGSEMDPFTGSALVDMYAKCGALPEAQESLTRLPVRGVVAWTALIAGYAEEGLSEEALYCLKQMKEEDVIPNAVTFVCSLKACGNLPSLPKGQELHADIAIEGLDSEPLVGTSLVDMYIKCGSLAEACEVFDRLSVQDIAAWNAMISGHTDRKLCEEALNYFRQMQLEGMIPNTVTFVLALKACGTSKSIERGQEIFMQVTKEGLDEDPIIGNTLIDFYAKCGSLIDAQQELDKLSIRDVVSWTSLITGYVEHGLCEEALESAIQMKSEGFLPDAGTFVCCLKACGNLAAIDTAQEIHTELVAQGVERDFHVGNTLVDMYAKCGWLKEAQAIFDKLQVQDVISWTALIEGYSIHGDELEAMNCFRQMQLKGVPPDVMTWNNIILGYAEHSESAECFDLYRQTQEQGLLPNQVTFTNVLKACGSTAALKVGKRIVAHIYGEAGCEAVEIATENAVIDMYGRCGSMADAQNTFDAMPRRQLVTWNGLITGYARQGESDTVFVLLSKMREEGIQPNEVTLLCVLSACNHAGLVDRGKEYFKAMKTEYRLEGNILHHNCMIDLLGRAGRFDEVLILIQEMRIQPNLVTWMTLLSACQTWGNIVLGRHAFENLVKLERKNIAAFVIIANMYANANMWDEVKKIELMRASLGLSHDTGKTWIEVGGVSHSIMSDEAFLCGGSKDKNMKKKKFPMGGRGECLPNFTHLLKNLDGSIVSAYGSAPIRIVKNSWICDDCHATLAVMSKATKHSICCRDANCIHIFKDGKCTCM